MSGDIGSVISKSGLVENVEIEVEIASFSQAVQKLLPLPFFSGRHLGFPVEGDVGFSGVGTIEKPVPENGG